EDECLLMLLETFVHQAFAEARGLLFHGLVKDHFFQLRVDVELVKDVLGNLPLRGRIPGGPIRPEELPHRVMIRLQHGNSIFRAASCLVTRSHGILLRLLSVQRHASQRESQDTTQFSYCYSLLQALCHGYADGARLMRAGPGDTGMLCHRRQQRSDGTRDAAPPLWRADYEDSSDGRGATSAGCGGSSRVAQSPHGRVRRPSRS